MKIANLKKAFIAASILVAAGHSGVASAHGAGTILDPAGNLASATDLAAITCEVGTQHLAGRIKDKSGPDAGQLLSFHIYKGQQMTTSTDTVSGDDNYSPLVTLNGGPGTYLISATKTKAGARDFEVEYHCEAEGGAHTNTASVVYQIQ